MTTAGTVNVDDVAVVVAVVVVVVVSGDCSMTDGGDCCCCCCCCAALLDRALPPKNIDDTCADAGAVVDRVMERPMGAIQRRPVSLSLLFVR